MPAPHTPRGVQQGQARALNRGAKGMGGGKYAGTSPVQRQPRTARTDVPALSDWVYDGTIRCSFGLTDPGIVAAGATGVAGTDGIAFTGTPADYVDATTFLRAGLYILEGTIEISGTAGDFVKVSTGVGDNQDDHLLPVLGSLYEWTFSVTGPASPGESFIPWSVENLGANSVNVGPSGLGQLYPIILP